MPKDEYIEAQLAEYERLNGRPLPAHNRGILRAMYSKEYDWLEGEEGRMLNDNNRYPE